MGNTIETKLKEENPVLEVTETLVGQFKDYISMADHSMAGLAKSMDAMRDGCEMLLRQFDKGPQLQDATTGTESDKGNNEQLARHLLEMIDASVSDHKYVVMESISKLFNFVWDVGKRYTDNTENGPLVFLVDKYKSERNSVGVEDGVSYTDLRIRALQREKQILQDKYTTSEKELKILNRRESEYRKEIKILENVNKAQKERIENLTEKQNSEVEEFNEITFNSDYSTEMIDLKEENSSLKQEYEQLKKYMIDAKNETEKCLNQKELKINELEQELQNLKIDASREMPSTVDKETSMEEFDGLVKETNMREDKETSMDDFDGLTKETNMREEIDRLNQKITALTTNTVLHGYEYGDKITNTRCKTRIKEDLYEKLKSEMAVCCVNLEISPWYPSSVVSIPTDKMILVPVFVGLYEKLISKIQLALQGMNAVSNIVVLVFYDADLELLCEEMKKPLPEGFNNLGGIFKFGYLTLKQPKIELNESSYKELLQFLKSKCVERRGLSR